MLTRMYDIAAEVAEILGEEEWTEETESRLESLGMVIEVKAKNIVGFCADLESFVAAAKAEEGRIEMRRKAAENRINSLKAYVKRCMEMMGREELQAGTHTIKLQKNPPAVVVDDESLIPARFFEIIPATTRLDKKAVAAAIKAGESVDGVHLASGISLRIK